MKSSKPCEGSSASLKGIVTDNDSGYISQNIESNSSYDSSMDHRQSVVPSELDIKEAFLNEDALLEKPPLTLKSDTTEDCGEFEHLYFMSNISDSAIVPSSVTSQSTTFSGFDEVLNLSETIPTAPTLIITEAIPDSLIKMKTFVLHPDKENDGNYENVKNNLKTDSNECKLNSSYEDAEGTSNSIQNRLMSANNDMSLFESFYSFVCKLYTKNEPVSEDPAISSINPSQLHLNQKQNEAEGANNNSPYKNLYLELENAKKIPEFVNSSTPTKRTSSVPSISPELFSDDEGGEPLLPNNSLLQKSIEQVVCDDHTLAKRTRDSLGGVPPPPSITLPLISASEILDKVKQNEALFTTQEDIDNLKRKDERPRCLLIDSDTPDFKSDKWPEALHFRYHGIHYNRSKISEEFEHLCVKYIERYIGAETQSSCTAFGIGTSSPKKKFRYGRIGKSPRKNLSHMARRRITFTRDSLMSAGISTNCTSVGSRTRQIMVDAKKFDMLPRRKSPKKKSPRKTPRKSPMKKANTPKSSGKKKRTMSFSGHAIEANLNQLSFLSAKPSTTKRALFQSPPHKECNSSLSWFNSDNSNSSCSQHSVKSSRRALFPSPKRNSPSKMTISSLYPARRKMTPKRALFKSPDKQSIAPQEMSDRKRKRVEDDERPSNKLPKCATTENKDLSNESRPSTSLGSSQDISQHRKKKLMWTVAEALRTQSIDLKHPQFKVYASVLARVIRHFLPNLFTNGLRTEGSTTESMLRIAHQYSFAVTRGKTVDQIIREAQKRSRIRRPSGCSDYDKFGESSSALQVRNKENILQDRINIMEENANGKPQSKLRRSEKVERIRRVINFGEDNDVSNTSIR